MASPGSGPAVAVRRPRTTSHPLRHATISEAQSTLVTTLRAAGRTWEEIGRIMNMSPRQCRRILRTPPVHLHRPARPTDDAGPR